MRYIKKLLCLLNMHHWTKPRQVYADIPKFFSGCSWCGKYRPGYPDPTKEMPTSTRHYI